jgi:hypothetical protein
MNAFRVGLDRTYELWFWFSDLYVSIRALFYRVVINEDFERDVNGAGSKEALNGYF